MAVEYSVISTPKGHRVAVLRINAGPVNSMDLGVWEDLQTCLDKAENDSSIRGLILESALDGSNGRKPIFTAGNDINELLATRTTRERYAKFWTVSNVFLGRLLNSRLATAAAVNGACPAGGTAMLLCSDIRVATDVTSAGLNEVAIGISVPEMWIELMVAIVGKSKATDLLVNAKMVNAAKAFELGIVQHLVPSKGVAPAKAVADLRAKVLEQLDVTLALPDRGRVGTKRILQGDLATRWCDQKRLDAEAEFGFNMLSSKETIQGIQGYLRSLAKPKARKSNI